MLFRDKNMGLWSGLKKGMDFVFYIRPKQWVSWNFFKKSTTQTIHILKDIYKTPQKGQSETFYQALTRHKMTVQDADRIKNKFYYLSLFFVTFALGMFMYAIDGFFQGQIMRGVGSTSLVTFLLAQAFRYHFWYFQIAHKRLGCSFFDWISFMRSM